MVREDEQDVSSKTGSVSVRFMDLCIVPRARTVMYKLTYQVSEGCGWWWSWCEFCAVGISIRVGVKVRVRARVRVRVGVRVRVEVRARVSRACGGPALSRRTPDPKS